MGISLLLTDKVIATMVLGHSHFFTSLCGCALRQGLIGAKWQSEQESQVQRDVMNGEPRYYQSAAIG
jgi:hypothetical protein